MRLRTFLRSQERTANAANANEPAIEAATQAGSPPPGAEERPGWWSRRQAARRAASEARAITRVSANAATSPKPSLRARIDTWRQRAERDRSRWARRALDWPLVNWLEAAVWNLVALTLGASYYGSYGNLVGVLMAVGYAFGPAHVVPLVLDAPLTASVIGQFLLARWKSPAFRRWRLFAVTIVTAPLSLAGNALHGALVYGEGDTPRLDLSLLDLHRTDVWIRLIAAMVPAIGIILAVAVTELVLRERARLEELRERVEDVEPDSEPESHEDSQDASQPPPPGPRRNGTKQPDPRVLRLARTGADWKMVAAKTGLKEHAAKRELTAARKQIASESQADSQAQPSASSQVDSQEVAA